MAGPLSWFEMGMRSSILWAFTLLGWFLITTPAWAQKTRWVVYYSDRASPQEFSEYSLIVLESQSYSRLRPLTDLGKPLLGYLSLGEVEAYRPYFEEVKAEKILLQENANWKGSYFVDLRDPRWTRRVVEQLIPGILRRGFDGLFLDTLDNAAYLERENPTRYRGMTAAAARLVRTIRLHYPTIKIMMNRAYEILPEVERQIDMELGESVLADYDAKTKTYRRVPEELYREQVRLLQAARKRRPELKVFTLDYWDPSDTVGIARIYREQRANGFEPYVATVELDRIVKEPQP